MRYPLVLDPQRPLRAGTPLRILGMVARPGDQGTLRVEDEQQRVRGALAALHREDLVELTWVAGQTYADLEDAMDRGPVALTQPFQQPATQGIRAALRPPSRSIPVLSPFTAHYAPPSRRLRARRPRHSTTMARYDPPPRPAQAAY